MADFSGQKLLIITSKYPASENRYQNAFVHSRVLSYVARGVNVRVLVIDSERKEPSETTFEGVSITYAEAQHAGDVIDQFNPSTIAIHFVSPGWFNVLRSHLTGRRIFIWMHGFEIEGWYRRWFNTAFNPEAINRLLVRRRGGFKNRRQFFEDLMADDSLDVGFVTVSNYFRNHVIVPDIGVPASAVAVIPNPVDTSVFGYSEKSVDLRFRVLSIRPFVSAAYGNDMLVSVVKQVTAKAPGQFRFTIIGDGDLFEETLKEIAAYENVDIHRGFLTPEEIAKAHRSHGIFLAPGRIDSQGVSRCEAMASGLVPVANAVAAVPEFIATGRDGLLAPPEDHVAMADGILDLSSNPSLFSQLSQNAAHNIRSLCDISKTTSLELELLLSSESASVSTSKFARNSEFETVDLSDEIDQSFAAALFAEASYLRRLLNRISSFEKTVEKQDNRIKALEGSLSRAIKRSHALEKSRNEIQGRLDVTREQLIAREGEVASWAEHASETLKIPAHALSRRARNLYKKVKRRN